MQKFCARAHIACDSKYYTVSVYICDIHIEQTPHFTIVSVALKPNCYRKLNRTFVSAIGIVEFWGESGIVQAFSQTYRSSFRPCYTIWLWNVFWYILFNSKIVHVVSPTSTRHMPLLGSVATGATVIISTTIIIAAANLYFKCQSIHITIDSCQNPKQRTKEHR